MSYRMTALGAVQRIEDGAVLSSDPRNADTTAYLEWTAEGNAPDPYAPPLPTAADVKAEAQRRITVAVGASDFNGCIVRQMNANMRAVELTAIRAAGGTWTSQEAGEAAALQVLADRIRAIRAASNVLEANIPANFKSNEFWP